MKVKLLPFLQVTITLDNSLKDSVLLDSAEDIVVDSVGVNRRQRRSLDLMADFEAGDVVGVAGEAVVATLEDRILALEDEEGQEEDEGGLQAKVHALDTSS